MAVTRERFEQGMTYEQFKAQMTRNQERFERNEQAFMLDPDDLAAFRNVPEPLHVLVLAEDWCGDVVDNLPIVGRLAAESGKLDVRVFLRDQNSDLMDQYLNRGEFRSIPVFAFFDRDFHELGHFIERPESVTLRMRQARTSFFAQYPEYGSPETPIGQLPEDARVKLMEEIAEQRERNRAANNADVVRALRAIVEGVPA
jgi:hypothetical protein